MRKIEGKEHLLKDESTGAVINTDRQGYLAYKQRKIIMQSKDSEIQELRSEVSELRILMEKLVQTIQNTGKV